LRRSVSKLVAPLTSGSHSNTWKMGQVWRRSKFRGHLEKLITEFLLSSGCSIKGGRNERNQPREPTADQQRHDGRGNTIRLSHWLIEEHDNGQVRGTLRPHYILYAVPQNYWPYPVSSGLSKFELEPHFDSAFFRSSAYGFWEKLIEKCRSDRPGQRASSRTKESCSRTLLSRCTSAETRWNINAVSRSSPLAIGWFSSLELTENEKLTP